MLHTLNFIVNMEGGNFLNGTVNYLRITKLWAWFYPSRSNEEEKVLYRTLKDSISATYLEPQKRSIHS